MFSRGSKPENLLTKFFVPFQLSKYTAFVESWMDELDENEDSWVPKQPVLMFSWFMDVNNTGVLLDKLIPTVNALRANYQFLTENQYKTIRMSKIRKNGPWRQDKETDIVQLAIDKTQGLRLSDSGNALLTILLGSVIEMGRNNGLLQKGLKLDTSSFAGMFSRAYVYLCTAQENKLKKQSKRLLGNPYTFSEWGRKSKYKLAFPRLLNHVPQSLSHLNIRKNEEEQKAKPECSACQKGYITYYGNTMFFGHAVKEDVEFWEDGFEEKDGDIRFKSEYKSGGNTTALCIQQLDDLLKAAGVDMNSKNPWYIEWVGTWQQAQKRLDEFKKKQQELYDIGDPRYNWVDYYYKWLILKVDVAVKKFADISDAKEGQEVLVGEALDELEDTPLSETLKSWAAKAFSLGAASAVVVYKIISLILVSPMTQELLIQFCSYIKESICQRIAIENGKAVLVRTKEGKKEDRTNDDGTPVLEQFNKETGEWFDATPEDQKNWAQADKKKRSDWWNNMAFRFFDVISSGTMLNGWMQTLSEMGTMVFGAVGEGIGWLLGMLEKLPLIGGVIGAIGGTGVVSPVVIAYLQKEAKSSWNEMVAANRRITQLKKLYQAMFSGWSDCMTAGKLVIKDGGGFGQTTYFKEAYYHAQFNIPYYAILVLNELAHRKENPDPKKAADIDAIIENLIRTELVAGAKAQKKLAEQAIEDQKNMEILEEKMKTMNEEDAKQELKEEINAKEAWKEKKKWLQYAALSAVVFMASGGTSGLAQAAAAIGGAASTAAATAATAASGATLATAATATATAAKTAKDFVSDYPDESAMMGTLFGMGGYKIYNEIKHWDDSYKIVIVQEVLKQAGVRKMLFYSQLWDKIKEFGYNDKGIKLNELKPKPEPEIPSVELLPWEKFEIMMKSKSGFFVYKWAKNSYINYEKANEFFKKYGSPHVDVSQEKTKQESTIHINNWGERRRRAAAKAKANSTSSKFRAVFKTKWLPKNQAGVQRRRRRLFLL